MLHELLLSLVGYSGNVIVESQKGFHLAPDFPFIHPSERELVDKICKLGYYFLQIDSYVQKHSQFKTVEGFYVRAMCEAINLILDSYRACVLKAEQQVLADTSTSLSHLLHILYDYEIIFPELNKLINSIQEQDLHGLAIADFLYKSSFTGIPEVQACINSLLSHCNKVFIDQATAWMVHGLLLDPHKEFFVLENTPNANTSTDNKTNANTNTNTTSIPPSSDSSSSPSSTTSTTDLFSLRFNMIPGYISFRVCEKILFIGWAVRVLQQQQKPMKSKSSSSSSSSTSGPVLQRTGSKKRFTRTKAKGLSTRALPAGEQSQITASLMALRDTVLRSLDLESVVLDIRTRVAKHLWMLVVEGAGLMDHLHAMRDYFFLSKGEFVQAFVDESRSLMALPPNQNAEHDLNVAFQQSAIRSTAHSDEFFENFHVRLDRKANVIGPVPSFFEGWKGIYLEYKIEWPLDLLFPPSIMDKYNTLFRFLLTVKRVQSELQRVWQPQMMGKRLTDSERAKLMPIWLLRRKMTFFIDNFQYYLMVNVLDTQYLKLCKRLEETRDFEAIRKFHEEYLDSLISQSFLHVKDVSKFLERLCLELCSAITRSESNPIDFLKINDLKKEFERQAGLLFKILSGVKSHHESPHLAQLLLFLDYNKYFTDVSKIASFTS